VMPDLPKCNTHLTTVAIAERLCSADDPEHRSDYSSSSGSTRSNRSQQSSQ
jgi:hypothetical protein